MELVTVTQFIREAALKSGVIKLSMGKTVGYQDAETVNVKDNRCWLCGGQTEGKGVPVKKAILATFNDRDKAKCLSSLSVCAGCMFCLTQRELRNYSTVATIDGLLHPDRPTLRGLLLTPPEPPFVIIVSISGQKHLHFKSAISHNKDEYWVQMEETRVGVYRPILAEILPVVESLYLIFSKDEIRTGRYNQNRIKEFGLNKYQEFEQKISIHRGQRMFELAVFVAQKLEQQQEEQKECITTSTPTVTKPQLALF